MRIYTYQFMVRLRKGVEVDVQVDASSKVLARRAVYGDFGCGAIYPKSRVLLRNGPHSYVSPVRRV